MQPSAPTGPPGLIVHIGSAPGSFMLLATRTGEKQPGHSPCASGRPGTRACWCREAARAPRPRPCAGLARRPPRGARSSVGCTSRPPCP